MGHFLRVLDATYVVDLSYYLYVLTHFSCINLGPSFGDIFIDYGNAKDQGSLLKFPCTLTEL